MCVCAGEAKENCESLRGQFCWASFTRMRHLGFILRAVERLQRIENGINERVCFKMITMEVSGRDWIAA